MLIRHAATKIRGHGEHLLDDGQVAILQSRKRGDMALRDDDDMHRPVGLRVLERQHPLSLRDTRDSNAPGKNLITVKVHECGRIFDGQASGYDSHKNDPGAGPATYQSVMKIPGEHARAVAEFPGVLQELIKAELAAGITDAQRIFVILEPPLPPPPDPEMNAIREEPAAGERAANAELWDREGRADCSPLERRGRGASLSAPIRRGDIVRCDSSLRSPPLAAQFSPPVFCLGSGVGGDQ